MTPTDILAVLGSITGVASLSWNIFTHFNQVKVVLKHKLSVEMNRPRLSLKLTNKSRITIYLETVELRFSPDTGGTRELPLRLNKPPRVISSLIDQMAGHRELKSLAPHEGCEYLLELPNADILGDTEGAFRYQYYITVNSPTDELVKISGSELLNHLRHMQQLQRALENKPNGSA